MAWGPTQDTGDGGVSLGVDLFNDATCTTSIAGIDPSDYEPYLFGIVGHSADHALEEGLSSPIRAEFILSRSSTRKARVRT